MKPELVFVTGSTGFIGTNLTLALLAQGYSVVGIDNFSASERWKANLQELAPQYTRNYEFLEADIVLGVKDVLARSQLLARHSKISRIYNLACPASPPRYAKLPLETIDVCTTGLRNVLDLARPGGSAEGARILHTSTSEVYGDPLQHPQTESYRGNVNIVGPRSCYDEGKRISETICYEYQRLFGLDICLVRLFNTYGPYMDPDDGRVVTNFILQALRGEDLTLFGDGLQTRSFQYIDDLLAAFAKLMALENLPFAPINIGNPVEFTMVQLAQLVLELIPNSQSQLVRKPLPQDDPKTRKPDITYMQSLIDWQPATPLRAGLEQTIAYLRSHLHSAM